MIGCCYIDTFYLIIPIRLSFLVYSSHLRWMHLNFQVHVILSPSRKCAEYISLVVTTSKLQFDTIEVISWITESSETTKTLDDLTSVMKAAAWIN